MANEKNGTSGIVTSRKWIGCASKGPARAVQRACVEQSSIFNKPFYASLGSQVAKKCSDGHRFELGTKERHWQ